MRLAILSNLPFSFILTWLCYRSGPYYRVYPYYQITRSSHRTGVACHYGMLTLPDTLSCTILTCAYVPIAEISDTFNHALQQLIYEFFQICRITSCELIAQYTFQTASATVVTCMPKLAPPDTWPCSLRDLFLILIPVCPKLVTFPIRT